MTKLYPVSLFQGSLLFPLTKETGLGLNGLGSIPQAENRRPRIKMQELIQLTINGLFQEG
jgi:hypothetical protein